MLAGLAVGVLGAFFLSRLMASLLYEIAPTDSLTFVGVVLAIAFTTLAACYLPARRATKVDPLVALRAE
jgi:putative ABC transport system permease protein